jgi:HPt (histidine-containing phosphotransfer) domain-containing protein
MTKFKVAYIDESETDIRRFQRFSFNYFEIVPIMPLPSISDTINKIMESNVDGIIADFDLSEQDPKIHFDGTDLVRKVLGKREGFPVFILTSFEDDAISKGDDVNIVYEKKEMDQGRKFLDRVKTQIEKYKHQLELNENRLLELLQESQKRNLDAFEKQELKELDSKIEKALDKESQIPNVLRDNEKSDELGALLKAVDQLADKLKKGDE